tara:strand:+ start:6217 stop:7053 length:837 start_codon:yes stop_codon:yes gene_type:complete
MNNYFVIGNPIVHSLSPVIHNHWFRKYNIEGHYEKKKLEEDDLKNFTNDIRNNKNINGANITVPFKKKIINFLDELSSAAQTTQSVNTIVKKNGKIIGYNTDVSAFNETIKNYIKNKFDNKSLNSLIIGAGGVTSSVISSLVNLNKINNTLYIMNRTKKKAEDLVLSGLTSSSKRPKVLDWGDIPQNLDIVINTTSVGLVKDESLNLDFSNYKGTNNTLFYDLIYNPKETNFLTDAKKRGNQIKNGKMMFLLQAKHAFRLWTNIDVEIDNEVLKLVDQ